MNLKITNFIANHLRPLELILLVKFLFRIKRKKVTTKNDNIFWVDPISHFGLFLLNGRPYEPEMTDPILEILENGDTFVDLGSNEGYFSVLASKRCGPTGKVYAIEPQKRMWDVIITNIINNKLHNVTLFPYAIGSEPLELKMTIYPSFNTGASTLSNSFNFKVPLIRKLFYREEKITVTTLDELSVNLGKEVKLMKIDIEGFEFEALKGGKKCLEQKIFKNILVEIHPAALMGMNQSVEQMDTYVKSFGYQGRYISSGLILYTA
jgi:FkbM family methyltransferase